MATVIQLRHAQNGLTANGYYGFSWTSFFFSGIPAIMRGDLGIGLGILALSIIGGIFSFSLLLFVVNIVWAFVYNKSYTRKLLERGYTLDPSDPNLSEARAALGVA
jgi:hypothetical protein